MKRCWEMAFMEHPTLLCPWVTRASLALPLHTGFLLFSGSVKVQTSPFWPLTPCSTSFPIPFYFSDFDPPHNDSFPFPSYQPSHSGQDQLTAGRGTGLSLERPAMESGWGQDFSDGGASFLGDEVVDLSWTCPLLTISGCFYLSLHLSVIIIIINYYYK